MLTISEPLRGGAAADYYLNLTQEDYYLNAPEAPGRWVGHGAAVIGLTGKVRGDDFRRVMEGRSPDGSLALVQNAGDPQRQSGWDLTFSAPKSVSVFWALSPAPIREQIEAIQQRAVEVTLAHLEQTAALTRRGRGGRIVEPAAAMFATFQHRTSRAQDPQLHTHAVLVNLALRQDGTTGSLLSHPIFKQKLALGAVYRVELAAGLQRVLGLALEPDEVGFHIRGVPRSLCREFSQRRQQIEQRLQERGLTSAVAAKIAALDTRPAKTLTRAEELFAAWRETGKVSGWGQEQAVGLIHPRALTPASNPPVETQRNTVLRSQREKRPRTSPRVSDPQDESGDNRSQFQQELARAVESIPPESREPRTVLPLAAQAAVRHGADAQGMLDGLADAIPKAWPRMPRWVRVEWHRLFDHTPWITPRRKFVYGEVFQPFPGAWWRPARDLRLRRLRVELPRIQFGRHRRAHRPKWWQIYWKKPVAVGELRVQQRFLFPHAPKWSPLYGLSAPALRVTTKRSKWVAGQVHPCLHQGMSY
ncbi:MAG: relaxase domain-containing protein [Verrucomicrobiales bacterium]|nr:relaxase domain-containing protein [Verrucomicrobiales bacterium]